MEWDKIEKLNWEKVKSVFEAASIGGSYEFKGDYLERSNAYLKVLLFVTMVTNGYYALEVAKKSGIQAGSVNFGILLADVILSSLEFPCKKWTLTWDEDGVNFKFNMIKWGVVVSLINAALFVPAFLYIHNESGNLTEMLAAIFCTITVFVKMFNMSLCLNTALMKDDMIEGMKEMCDVASFMSLCRTSAAFVLLRCYFDHWDQIDGQFNSVYCQIVLLMSGAITTTLFMLQVFAIRPKIRLDWSTNLNATVAVFIMGALLFKGSLFRLV